MPAKAKKIKPAKAEAVGDFTGAAARKRKDCFA